MLKEMGVQFEHGLSGQKARLKFCFHFVRNE